MSHYFENEDLWKLPCYDEINFSSLSEIKELLQKDKNLSTEGLTMALAEASGFYFENPDKGTAKEVMDILNLAVEHPHAGVAGGRNEDLDPYKYSQYYEVDSNTEARNLATLVIQLHPDMEKDVFDFYKKLSTHLPVYHDLAEISKEHPKAMDLFEELYNRDLNLYNENYNHDNTTKAFCTDSLFRAEQAMESFVSPENVDRIERMVNAYRAKENDRLDLIKGKIDAYHDKKLENSLSDKEEWMSIRLENYYKIEKKKSGHYGQGSLRERISKMKEKAATIEEHKKESRDKKKDISVDKLADKMKFIERRVSFVKENVGEVSREQEDKIRFSAYKEFQETR